MPKNPLFSTYRQGENRVTSSMLAVFERIDSGVLETLLASATGESSLAMVDFVNQVSAGSGSIPDAGISASFRYLFEVKTERNAIRAEQIAGHLDQLDGTFAEERLLVVTPDAVEPTVLSDIGDNRVVWFSFFALHQAIDELLLDPAQLISEQTEFLLRELQALFIDDGLLDEDDVVVVAARAAYPEYLSHAAYVCQPGRSFREGLRYMGFYTHGAIQVEVPAILHRRDNVEWSLSNADAHLTTGHPFDEAIGQLIHQMLDTSPRAPGEYFQVFLLSETESDQTIVLEQPIGNTTRDHRGRTTAWTQGQRYTSSDAIRGARATDDL